jgi:hypothetical protein
MKGVVNGSLMLESFQKWTESNALFIQAPQNAVRWPRIARFLKGHSGKYRL